MSNKETLANLFQRIAGPFKYPCQTSFKTGTVRLSLTSLLRVKDPGSSLGRFSVNRHLANISLGT